MTCRVKGAKGVHDLWFVFKGQAQKDLFHLIGGNLNKKLRMNKKHLISQLSGFILFTVFYPIRDVSPASDMVRNQRPKLLLVEQRYTSAGL